MDLATTLAEERQANDELFDALTKEWDNNIKRNFTPFYITLHTTIQHELSLCDKCEGLGRKLVTGNSYLDDPDYYASCSKCDADGRMIKITKKLHYGSIIFQEETHKVSYIHFKDHIPVHAYATHTQRMRIDNTNIDLERKFPALAAMSYDKYDESLKDFELLDAITK